MTSRSEVLRELMLESGTTRSGLSRLSGVRQPSINGFLSSNVEISDEPTSQCRWPITGSPYGMRSPLKDWPQLASGSVSFVTTPDVFRGQPVLNGQLVQLEPLTLAVLEDYVAALAEPEVRRLTDARATFDRPKIEASLATRGEHHDRADWAVLRAISVTF